MSIERAVRPTASVKKEFGIECRWIDAIDRRLSTNIGVRVSSFYFAIVERARGELSRIYTKRMSCIKIILSLLYFVLMYNLTTFST